MDVSEDHKAVARHLMTSIGGMPSVQQYWDKAKRSSIDIVSVPDRPQPGLVTHSTLGLFEHSIGLDGGAKPLRAELMLTLRADDIAAPKILSTCAMDVINDKIAIRPGSLLVGAVSLYRVGLAMTDILVVSPFIWAIPAIELSDKTVGWLAAIPISEAERNYAMEKGGDALDRVLGEKGAEVFNLERASVL